MNIKGMLSLVLLMMTFSLSAQQHTVSGTVVEVNEELEDAPELLNEDAFANWIMKVEMSDPSELETLMDAAAYEAMCANE